MRKPRIFTWWSMRPRNSMLPSDKYRARSPVLYSLCPGSRLNGSAMNRSAVRSARLMYPLATPTPPMYISPTTPLPTASILSSSMYILAFLIGLPIGTLPLSSSPPPASYTLHPTTASVGPYSFITLDPPHLLLHLLTCSQLNASPPTTYALALLIAPPSPIISDSPSRCDGVNFTRL